MEKSQKKSLTIGILVLVIVAILVVIGLTTKQPTTEELPIINQDTTTEQSPEQKPLSTSSNTTNQEKIMNTVTLKTTMGDITLEMNRANAPKTVENFITLAEKGFYDGIRFHRVIEGFMIQAGDPQSKDADKKSLWGTGGPGYKFDDELTGTETYPQGTLAMANAGPNTNGSQFFIVTASPAAPLPPSYTVFGKVTKGIDVALAIEKVQTESADRPVNDVIIEKVTVE